MVVSPGEQGKRGETSQLLFLSFSVSRWQVLLNSTSPLRVLIEHSNAYGFATADMFIHLGDYESASVHSGTSCMFNDHPFRYTNILGMGKHPTLN